MRYRPLTFLTIALLTAFACPGCVERKMTIKSEPPGARLYLDYKIQGQTPETLPFSHYGSRDVRLEKPGYRTKQQSIVLETPLHSTFPINFFTELLYPFTIVDHQTFTIALEPEPLPGRVRDGEEGSEERERSEAVERARNAGDSDAR